MAKASALSLAWSTEPSPSMRAASARDSASALAVPVLSTAVLETAQSQGDPAGSPALPFSALDLCCSSTRTPVHTPTHTPPHPHPHTSLPSAALPRPSAIFSSRSPPTSEPPALRVPCELFQLLIGLRSSVSQAGRGLLVLVSEPRAWVGEGIGKTLAWGQSWNRSSKGRDPWPMGGP